MSDKEAAPAKKKGGKLIAILACLVMTAGGAGGTWFFMQRNAHAAPAAEKPAPPKKALFSALEPFTVNLQEPRGDRFAQIGVTLEFDEPELETKIKDRLPALRNNILMLLSAKRVDELLTPEGKAQLADEIRVRAGQALGHEAPAAAAAASGAAKAAAANPVRGVLFSQFIVQ